MNIWSWPTYYNIWITWHWHHLHYFAFVRHYLHNYIFVTWYCHCLHYPVILIHIIFTSWHWYPWHCFWIIYIESHTILHLHWLIKLTKSGLLGGDCRRENLGMCAWKGDPLRVWMPHVILLFMRTPVITCYMSEYSELFLPTVRIH